MDVTRLNREAWDQIAVEEDRWFRALSPTRIENARVGDWELKLTPTRRVPRSWFGDSIEQKKILCLAAGGGQQAPLLAAAGADVTVADFSSVQLNRDRQAAEQFGLKIQCLQMDMADLSDLNDLQFDLIVNPTSVCYIPDVKPVWKHCFRILKSGGGLMTGFMLPVNFLFDPILRDRQKLAVQNSIPYSDFDLPAETQERILSPVRPAEFGHSLTELIGEALGAGFHLVDFFTDRWGDRDKLSDHLDVFGCCLFRKP